MSNPVQEILHDLEIVHSEMVEWRRYMHQHPELSFEEIETAAFIADKLRAFGLDVKTGIGGNGVTGFLQGKNPGKTVALRADFDALPIPDEKNVAYRSQNPGAMHACGHDGHTAALLGLAKVLSSHPDALKGNVLFVFQHAEEKPPGGAKSMIETGLLNEVDYVYAAHLASDLPLGQIALGSGVRMAAVDKFKITVQGKGGHGARPQQAVDSIVIGSQLVTALQQIVSRHVDPLKSAVVTIGVFQAGQAFNVIADTAVLEGTVRTFDPAVRKQTESDIRTITEGLTRALGAEAAIEYINGYPALVNDAAETERAGSRIEQVLGSGRTVEFEPSMGAEDFAYFLNERPGTYVRVGSHNGKPETQYPHHHPKFDFDEQALLDIGQAFTAILSGRVL